MDVDAGKWKQIGAPQAAVSRRGHSTMVFSLGPRHFLLVVYGGISEWSVDKSHREQPIVTETAVIELFETEGGDWNVYCDDTPPTPTPLPHKGDKFFAENGTIKNSPNSRRSVASKRNRGNSGINTMTLDRRSVLQKQLEESRKENKAIQSQLAESLNELKKTKKQSEDLQKKKNRLETDLDGLKKEFEKLQLELEQAEKKVEDAEKAMSNQSNEIQELKSKKSTDSETSSINGKELDESLWVILPDEIKVTQAELSRDNWSSVCVGSYRGLHVAAKCFKDGLISEDNVSFYYRSIELAVKIRHPNIIQFIGATNGLSPPIIITELMPTSLKMTLRQGPLSKRQVLSVASDVAGALCYLHQWKPKPIIHRNITTSSILMEPLGNSTWRAKLSDCCTSNFINYLGLHFLSNQHQSIFAAPESKAPELYTTKTDVYSFGVTLLEMCQPAEGIAPTNDLRPRLQRLVWQAMANLIRMCTCGAPDERLSMNEIVKRLGGGNGTNTESLV
jgi:archaellum component FlaC